MSSVSSIAKSLLSEILPEFIRGKWANFRLFPTEQDITRPLESSTNWEVMSCRTYKIS